MGRPSLPILFAQVVAHSEQARFLELCRAVPDSAALAEAQAILIRSGAISYAVDQLLRRHELAQKMLVAMLLAHPDKLEPLLADLVTPVQALFQATGGVTDRLSSPATSLEQRSADPSAALS
jgi:hypothetical protein